MTAVTIGPHSLRHHVYNANRWQYGTDAANTTSESSYTLNLSVVQKSEHKPQVDVHQLLVGGYSNLIV